MNQAQVDRYWDELYGSEYLSPVDLNGKRVTVKIVKQERLALSVNGAGAKKPKIVFSCEGCRKKVAMNKTSAKRLALAWGKDFSSYVGRSITIEGGMVMGKPALMLYPAGVRDDESEQAQADADQWEAEQAEEARIAAAQGQK